MYVVLSALWFELPAADALARLAGLSYYAYSRVDPIAPHPAVEPAADAPFAWSPCKESGLYGFGSTRLFFDPSPFPFCHFRSPR